MPELLPTSKSKDGKTEAFLKLARERFRLAYEADRKNRDHAIEDLEFFDGKQWPDTLKAVRENDGRPCLVINKLQEKVDQVVGDMLQNRPGMQVVGVDDVADPKIAETYEGIVRHIESNSDAEEVYSHAFEHATICGMANYRVLTQYVDDDIFEQEIVIGSIDNPLSVYWDPAAKKKSRRDAKHAFVSDMMTKEQFLAKYPDAEPSSFEGAASADEGLWNQDGRVRVCEYWIRYPVKKTIWLFEDGTVRDQRPLTTPPLEGPDGKPPEQQMEPKPPGVIRERLVDSYRVVQYIISGTEILSGPNPWAGKWIPLIPVWGKELNIKGERRIRGLVRYAKDAQRMFNYWESLATEAVALAPRTPWLLTGKQIDKHERAWGQSHERSMPYLLYNADINAPPPKRQSMPGIPTGLEQRAKINSEHIKSTTGLYDPSLGAKSNETSGRAILLRQREGDTATYAYINNFIRSLGYLGKILIDLIPRIYDTSRVIRITGKDGNQSLVPINKKQEDGTLLNDLTIGRYDVVIDAGPSYTTQRQEALEAMMKIAQSNPEIFLLIGHKLVQSMDWPGAQEIAEVLKPVSEFYLKQLTGGGQQEGPSPEEQAGAELDAKLKKAQADKAHFDALTSQGNAAKIFSEAGVGLPTG